jgi:hypothetical protein
VLPRTVVLGLSALLLSGCLPPVLQVASWTVTGISYVFSGKGVGDHVLSLATKKDCATWRVLQGKRICVNYVKMHGNGWDSVVSTFKVPTFGTGDDPHDFAMDGLVQLASAAEEFILFDFSDDVESDAAFTEDDTNRQAILDDAIMVAMAKTAEGAAPASGSSNSLMLTEAQPANVQPVNTQIKKFITVDEVDRPTLSPGSYRGGKAKGLYLVIGSFRSNQRAMKLQARHTGLSTAIMQARVSGRSLYRVLAGPFNKSELGAARWKLAKSGVRHSWAMRLCTTTLTPPLCVTAVQQAALPN